MHRFCPSLLFPVSLFESLCCCLSRGAVCSSSRSELCNHLSHHWGEETSFIDAAHFSPLLSPLFAISSVIVAKITGRMSREFLTWGGNFFFEKQRCRLIRPQLRYAVLTWPWLCVSLYYRETLVGLFNASFKKLLHTWHDMTSIKHKSIQGGCLDGRLQQNDQSPWKCFFITSINIFLLT